MKRLLTKESREQSRQYQFEQLLKNGYQKEVYKDVTIFFNSVELIIKTFHGTAAKHTDFIKFRTLDRLNEKIKQVKDSADYREKWRAEQKEKNKGKLSNQAAAAAAIRTELKAAFPFCKFSVTSESFAGGDSVNISWTDGPTIAQVETISSKYQYGKFNGMDDLYENTNCRDDIPQSKYVSESRSLSDEIVKIVSNALQAIKQYSPADLTDYRRNPQQEAKQLLYITDIPHNYTGLQVVPDYDNNRNEPYKIVFEIPKNSPEKQQTATEAKPGTVQIIAHPIRPGKILVIGETYALKDILKTAGGWWNKWEKGWEFKADKLEDIKAVLLSAKQPQQQQAEPEPQQPEPLPEPEQKQDETQDFENLEVLPTPENSPLQLEYFKIIWHEGRHIPNATFENITFQTWAEVQKAFTILWFVNEKGSGGGYTKVKCEIALKDQTPETVRIDITDKASNGDFNPSLQHISDYLTDDEEMSEQDEAMRNALLY